MMPDRGWETWQDHWPVDGLEAETARGDHVHRLGNLTLLTSSLNSKVSNSAWPVKRRALGDHDTLLLNSRLLSQAGDSEWTEDTIDARSAQLIDVMLRVWPVPEGHTGQVVDPRDKSQDWVEIKDLVVAGLLDPDTLLTPRQGRWTSQQARVREDGMLEIDGRLFGSPSGAGRQVKGSVTNGWTFWRLADGRRLIDVRAEFRGEKPKDAHWTAALPRIEWTEDELADYASGAAELTVRLLDHVATDRPDQLLTGTDFVIIGLTSEQVSGITGAMARKVYSDFERSNPPIEFVDYDGRWHYRMTAATAAAWRAVRAPVATSPS